MSRANTSVTLPLLAACLMLAATASGQDRGIAGTTDAASPAQTTNAEPRVALVIGNTAYKDIPLRNPKNDATDMAEALRACGFKVIEKTDCDLRAMVKALDEFGKEIVGAEVALFFYAGHGIQVNGCNYLLPLGAKMDAPNEAQFECLEAARVLTKMETARTHVNILMLDACRSNPFARSWRALAKGLAPMDAPPGSFMSFATSPGKEAHDGTGRNGVYSAGMLNYMRTPGLKIEEVFKRASQDVQRATGGEQVPWMSFSYIGDFYFVPPVGDTELAKLPPQVDTSDLEALAASVKARQELVKKAQEWFGNCEAIEGTAVATGAGAKERLALWDAYLDKFAAVEYRVGDAQAYRDRYKNWRPPTVIKPEPPKPTVVTPQRPPGGPKDFETRTFSGIEMVWIPPGTFTMGSKLSASETASKYGGESKHFEGEHPQHEVTLTQGLWLGTYQVTKRQWKAVMDSEPWKGEKYVLDDPDSPAVCVSWEDAQAFCKKLGDGFRLPTEAQWEYACRAGTTTVYSFGDDASRLDEYAWYEGNADSKDEKYAHVVGKKKPNPWGLYDMHGNVWEWCEDSYDEDYYEGSPASDPHNTSTGAYRVLRGGGWLDYAYYCRSAIRGRGGPCITGSNIGFRVARSPSAR